MDELLTLKEGTLYKYREIQIRVKIDPINRGMRVFRCSGEIGYDVPERIYRDKVEQWWKNNPDAKGTPIEFFADKKEFYSESPIFETALEIITQSIDRFYDQYPELLKR